VGDQVETGEAALRADVAGVEIGGILSVGAEGDDASGLPHSRARRADSRMFLSSALTTVVPFLPVREAKRAKEVMICSMLLK